MYTFVGYNYNRKMYFHGYVLSIKFNQRNIVEKKISDYTDQATKEILKIQAQRCATAAKIEMAKMAINTESDRARQILDAILKCGEI